MHMGLDGHAFWGHVLGSDEYENFSGSAVLAGSVTLVYLIIQVLWGLNYPYAHLDIQI